jgi:RNA polymerase sigma factor (sigma-70 family)
MEFPMHLQYLQDGAVPCGGHDPQSRFTNLFNEVQPAVVRYANYLCRRASNPLMVAQDLVQDSLTVAWTRFDDLREGVQFKTWLISIMQRTYCNYSRAERRHNPESVDCQDQPEPVDSQSERSSLQLILEMRHALMRLKTEERQCLLLFTLGGMSIDELSAFQHCKVDCMKKRLERARKKMRLCLEGSESAAGKLRFSEDILAETFTLLDAALPHGLPIISSEP